MPSYHVSARSTAPPACASGLSCGPTRRSVKMTREVHSARNPSKSVGFENSRRHACQLLLYGMISSHAGAAISTELAFPQTQKRPDPNTLLQLAQKEFKQGQAAKSADLFDMAIELKPQLEKYLWQRGLSLYYAGRYEAGSKQFQLDTALNPNDTEEAIWKLLCDARTAGFQEAQAQIIQVGMDSRPVMRAAYSLFKGTGSIDQLLEAGNANSSSKFYSLLYAGLYEEAKGHDAVSLDYIREANATVYAKRISGDYMVDLAKVHFALRTGGMPNDA